MTFEGEGIEKVPEKREIPHYHGDEVRVLFFLSALVLIVAQSTGADLPLTGTEAVIAAVLLVLAAGITNPAQMWIHWVNGFLAVVGTLIFGSSAVVHYRAGSGVFDPSFLFIEALALLSVIALYLATMTIRGTLLRPEFGGEE